MNVLVWLFIPVGNYLSSLVAIAFDLTLITSIQVGLKMLVLEKFLWCCKLETGGLILASFKILCSIMAMVHPILVFTSLHNEEFSSKLDSIAFTGYLCVLLLCGIVELTTCCLLIYGIQAVNISQFIVNYCVKHCFKSSSCLEKRQNSTCRFNLCWNHLPLGLHIFRWPRTMGNDVSGFQNSGYHNHTILLLCCQLFAHQDESRIKVKGLNKLTVSRFAANI